MVLLKIKEYLLIVALEWLEMLNESNREQQGVQSRW